MLFRSVAGDLGGRHVVAEHAELAARQVGVIREAAEFGPGRPNRGAAPVISSESKVPSRAVQWFATQECFLVFRVGVCGGRPVRAFCRVPPPGSWSFPLGWMDSCWSGWFESGQSRGECPGCPAGAAFICGPAQGEPFHPRNCISSRYSRRAAVNTNCSRRRNLAAMFGMASGRRVVDAVAWPHNSCTGPGLSAVRLDPPCTGSVHRTSEIEGNSRGVLA